ncbi:MAG: methyltransferase [Promethearchaeota archaeon]|nr:MAG: methyltransferase [Candidatus Lokiarchaeota archaeon]
MNSRERVLASINHKEPDRVPIDLGSSTVTGINAIAYDNLKKYLGITTGHTRIYDVVQQLAQVEDNIIDLFKIDVLDVGRTFNTTDQDWYDVHVNGIDAQFPNFFKPRHNPDDSYDILHSDGTVLGTMTKDALVFDQTYYPCLHGYPDDYFEFQKMIRKVLSTAVTNPPFSNIGQRHFWRTLRANATKLKEDSDKAIMLNLGIGTFELASTFRKWDKFLIDAVKYPSKVEKLLDMLMTFNIESLKVILGYVGDVIDIIRIGDDLGENKGPLISPRIYRKLVKPTHVELCDFIKKHSSMKIFFHSCGSIAPIIPDLIEAGIDILNPVQISARNMDPKYLKENFGDDLTFWGGGIDTRNVINFKSPEEVKKHVLNLLEIFTPGGGYVWSAVHNILAEVPPQNIIAAFEAIEEFNNKK